jgi:bifunctional non-homologous end joining protein LigD
MALTEYWRKRDFTKTKEPSGREHARKGLSKKKTKELSFVVQKHDASHLHYDFRLEFEGVLKSWSVPKGPSLDPHDKRLAIEVEDHPLGYASFEGVIPAGEYGGGDVIVWDRGTWSSDGDIGEQLRKGNLKFTLKGEKLEGSWALVRTHRPSKKPQWLLIKHTDEYSRSHEEYDVVAEHPESVKTGRLLPRDEGEDKQEKAERLSHYTEMTPVKAKARKSARTVKKKPKSSRASSSRSSQSSSKHRRKARSGSTKLNSTATARS